MVGLKFKGGRRINFCIARERRSWDGDGFMLWKSAAVAGIWLKLYVKNT